jgi:hypothetical protein
MSSHAESIPRGAYAPRSCFAMRTSDDEKTIFAIHIRTSGQERRPSARRGSRIAPARTIPRTSPHVRHTQCQERRASAHRGSRIAPARTIPGTSAHDRRTQHQERRASARRGFVNRVCNCNAMNFAAWRLRVRIGNAPHGGLRGRLHLECAETDEFARGVHPTGGLRPPLLFRECAVFADEKTIFAIHIRTSGQERRALARRGSEIVPARTIPRTSPHDRHTQHQERRASARRGNETHLQDGSLCVRRTTPPAAVSVSQPSASPVGVRGMANGNVGEQDSRHPPTLPC